MDQAKDSKYFFKNFFPTQIKIEGPYILFENSVHSAVSSLICKQQPEFIIYQKIPIMVLPAVSFYGAFRPFHQRSLIFLHEITRKKGYTKMFFQQGFYSIGSNYRVHGSKIKTLVFLYIYKYPTSTMYQLCLKKDDIINLATYLHP